ncbi:COG2329 Uncharacterized enzyme involved in biosynthesis of extracellular polysaccharides [Rhabdaerophilaceae bacterium]
MIAVIFEVEPSDEGMARYLGLAAELKPELEAMEGFVSVERFQSLAQPGKVLSLSFWRDEKAVALWRNQAHHRTSQQEGRAGLLGNYRLRVAEVVRDYGLNERLQAPVDSRKTHG